MSEPTSREPKGSAPREPKGADVAWTGERRRSDEGPPPQAARPARRRSEGERGGAQAICGGPQASGTTERAGGKICLIAIRDTEPSVDEVRAAVSGPRAGGIALFVGAVRDTDHDQGVTGLSYTAHPSAEAELRRIAEMIAEKFNVLGIAAVHRVGDLAVGDLAVVTAVACAHRAEAFDACRELIDAVKSSVPIWKHQRFADGTTEWVGTP